MKSSWRPASASSQMPSAFATTAREVIRPTSPKRTRVLVKDPFMLVVSLLQTCCLIVCWVPFYRLGVTWIGL